MFKNNINIYLYIFANRYFLINLAKDNKRSLSIEKLNRN